MSGSSFLFLASFGKVVLLRSVRGKLMTRIKSEKLSELKYFYAKKFLFGILGAVPRSSILNNCGQSRIRKEHVCLSICFGYQLKRRKRRKGVDLKNCCDIFKDYNHQSLYENRLNSIMTLTVIQDQFT